MAQPAPYVKELAARLHKNHTVTIVTYGHIPEQIPGVTIIAIQKRQPLPLRLISFTIALWRAAKSADVVYAQNGASVELPAGFVAHFCRTPLILHIGDTRANERARQSATLGFLQRFVSAQAKKRITDSPGTRPEIVPFAPIPDDETRLWNKKWEDHMHMLQNIFTHAS